MAMARPQSKLGAIATPITLLSEARFKNPRMLAATAATAGADSPISPADITQVCFERGDDVGACAGAQCGGGGRLVLPPLPPRGAGQQQERVYAAAGVKKESGIVKSSSERSKEAKRQQNRECARRFRRAQKARLIRMKEDNAMKTAKIAQLEAKIAEMDRQRTQPCHCTKPAFPSYPSPGSVSSFASGPGRPDAACMPSAVDSAALVSEAELRLYSQLLSFNPLTERPNLGTFASGLGAHLRTFLATDEGLISRVLRSGQNMQSLLKALGSVRIFWEGVPDHRQAETMKNALTRRQPVAIAYHRPTPSRLIMINAAVTPVGKGPEVVIAEFLPFDELS